MRAAVSFITLLAVFGAVRQTSGDWSPPALAYIVAGGEYLCDATIIDDFFVITAGSCIENLDVNSTETFVRVGSSKNGASVGSFSQSIRAINTYYDDNSSPNPGPGKRRVGDWGTSSTYLGIVEVESRFSYGGNVKWSSPTYQTTSTNYEGVVVTWGNVETLYSNVVSAPVSAITTSSCKSYLGSSVTLNSTQTCVLPTISTSYPCKAELGAPFYRNQLLYGVVTYNPGCSSSSSSVPVVITNTFDAADFIFQSITGQSNAM